MPATSNETPNNKLIIAANATISQVPLGLRPLPMMLRLAGITAAKTPTKKPVKKPTPNFCGSKLGLNRFMSSNIESDDKKMIYYRIERHLQY
jgi:hypothetical protein